MGALTEKHDNPQWRAAMTARRITSGSVVAIAVLGVVCLAPHSRCAEHTTKEVPARTNRNEVVLTTLFNNADDALSVLLDRHSELQWEASRYLKEHPSNALARLQHVIEEQDPSYFIAMCTLTGIGGESVTRFYCDLLDRNRYEMETNGTRKIQHGCGRMPNAYGKAIVEQIGRLGDKAADPCLQRAWLDSEDSVRAAVPKARYDIGALSITDLVRLAKTDVKDSDLYYQAMVDIAYDKIHENTDTAIDILETVCALPAGYQARDCAHSSLVQCYELKKDYEKALEYFNAFKMPDRAKAQAKFILQNCLYDYVLTWVRNRMTKQKEIAARSSQAAEAATGTNSAGRPFTPPSWGKGEPDIFIARTGGWKKTVTKGQNFDLHQVVSTSSTASLTIYVGPHVPKIGKTAATTTTMVAVGTNAVAFAVTERDSHYYAEGIVKDAFRGYADADDTSVVCHK